GAPRIELEIVRRLHGSGSIQPEVLSPCDGPLRRAYEQAGIPIRVEPALAGMASDPKRYRDAIPRLAELIKARPYEVVHANTLQTFWAVDAARVAGTPSVWS